jgi:hypothetical protein
VHPFKVGHKRLVEVKLTIFHYVISARKPQGKKVHGRFRHRWEGNIKMNRREIVCELVRWIQQSEGRAQWWSFVTILIKLSLLKEVLISLTPKQLSNSNGRFCTMELV